jgi:GSH-dependent disulfide-bond oxidoreductase
MLEEVGLPYTVRLVDITAGEQFSPDFLTISPNNKIPALTDSDETGELRVLFESGAILIYLAEKTGLLLAPGGQRRAEALSWLFWATSGLGPTIGRFLQHVSILTGQSGKDPFEHETIRLMRILDKRLSEAPFLAGAYSIADIAAFAWLKFALPMIKTRLGGELGITPGIDCWLNEINARDAVRRGLRASKTVLRRNASHST